eukprot:scaffold450898_cov18-Prasinocladus_malaysianus.AAC.1
MNAGGIRSVSFSAVMPDYGADEPPIEEETVQFQVPQFVIGTDEAKVSCPGQTNCTFCSLCGEYPCLNAARCLCVECRGKLSG